MRPSAVEHLCDPSSRRPLTIASVGEQQDGEIREGELAVEGSDGRYAIRNFIPRFVPDSSYTASFGEQWNRYRRIQIDRFNGTTLSRDRFFRDTGWRPEEIAGQRILEAGGGAGRFTQVMLDAGAQVYSIDYSTAVDASWTTNGLNPNLFLAQADIYALPFKHGFFDKVFCYGVLQHTPDARRAFSSLLPFLKPGGKIAVDVYRKLWWVHRWTAKFWYRPVTKRMSRDRLRKIVEWYVPRWIPIDNMFQRIPMMRYVVPAIVPCWNYTGMLPLTPEQIEQWAILDTFDALSPQYDSPQTISTVQEWFQTAGLKDVDVRYGGNGILGNAVKP